MRDTLILEAKKFTNLSALGKELEALLRESDYKLEVHLGEDELEELAEEYENLRCLGRLKFRTLDKKRQKTRMHSMRWENVNDQYMRFPDGRLVAFNTPKAGSGIAIRSP